MPLSCVPLRYTLTIQHSESHMHAYKLLHCVLPLKPVRYVVHMYTATLNHYTFCSLRRDTCPCVRVGGLTGEYTSCACTCMSFQNNPTAYTPARRSPMWEQTACDMMRIFMFPCHASNALPSKQHLPGNPLRMQDTQEIYIHNNNMFVELHSMGESYEMSHVLVETTEEFVMLSNND